MQHLPTESRQAPLVAPLTLPIPGGSTVTVEKIGTTNEKKLEELYKGGLQLESVPVESVEPQTNDLHLKLMLEGGIDNYKRVQAEISAYKALAAYEQYKGAILIEDTGLYLKALPTVVGPYVKNWVKDDSNGPDTGLVNLCTLAHSRREVAAVAVVSVGVSDGEKVNTWTAAVEGIIADSPRGDQNFAWDRIFIPEPNRQAVEFGWQPPKTWAEMSFQEKQSYFPFRKRVVDILREVAIDDNVS